ncbi:Penicillin-binding protein 1B [BD1-7 clade bacterium]|uniref:Penicillin-binding protein 1B n=1 Tax=BD1-7 clade bacterium TaxID=2029982 RepID=A0A5S9MQR9_9GAMM|nr:Penicillin-binding protein 1B [BD1-7 clade bacterium]CAA0085385.1 Penicillin-binding protein 1B [BD1-7 clade bacterium]
MAPPRKNNKNKKANSSASIAPAKKTARASGAGAAGRSWVNILVKVLFTGLILGLFVLAYLDAWVMERFEGRKWQVPAMVYARPLILYEGLVIDMQTVVDELHAAGYQSGDTARAGAYRRNGSKLEIHRRGFDFHNGFSPARRIQLQFKGGRLRRLADPTGASSVRLEPVQIGTLHPRLHEARQLVSIEQVPQGLIDALLSTEDRDFYAHLGVSPKAIARAMRKNMHEGRVVQGGSTITQQLVKNFFLTGERSYGRKALEAVIAVLLELRTEKDDILEAYINEVFIAQDGSRAIHGFGLASAYLFSRPLRELDPHESALLVAMMKGPSYYNPLRHPERALERRNLVLAMMAEQGHLSQQQLASYSQKPLGVERRRRQKYHYSAYLDLVREQLRRDYSDDALSTQGLRIHTYLDPQWQWRAQKQLIDGIQRLSKRYGKKAEGVQGAAVVVDHSSGDVIAVAGGTDVYHGAYNRALNARRPIGSLVKPAIYLTAFEKGYTLQTPISDEPLMVTYDNKKWQPQNFDRRSHTLADITGDQADQSVLEIPLYQALARSYNLAAVRLGTDVGIRAVTDTLRRLGFEGRIPYLPAMLLGAVEMRPLDVAQIYATIANRGFYAPLQAIRNVTDDAGQELLRYPLKMEQRIALGPVHMLDYSLQAVMHEGTGRSVARQFASNHRIAGKTGTSDDQRDSWFAGYDNGKTTAVWLGFDDNRPLPFTAAGGALPVWASVMRSHRGVVGAGPVPEGINYLWVDQRSGALSRETCDGAIYLPFMEGTEPTEEAPCYKENTILHWFKTWFQ